MPPAGHAQLPAPSTRPLRVGLYTSPPFVMPAPSGQTGYAIELWESIARRLGVTHEYRAMTSLPELLRAVSAGDVDVVVTNLTITPDRLALMDFTQPWFDGGLRIMINQDRRASVTDLLSQLYDDGHIRVYLWIGGLILAATIILTVVDRQFDPEFPREWHKGGVESFYHVMSVVTSGSAPHKELFGAFGRVLSAVWMVVGVAVVAYVTSSVTSVMTANNLTTRINSIADLPGKTVGVLRGSAAETFAIDAAWSTQAFDRLEDAVDALVKRRIDALAGDAPVLEYYDNNNPELPITEVGGVFKPEKYGFAVPIGSPYLRDISRQIVLSRENGYLLRLHNKYFGNTP